MGQYESKLNKYVHSKGAKGFIRLFKNACPNCGEEIFNVNEKVEADKIVGYFLCNCGKKFKEVMYSKELKKYKCPQGMVKNYKRKGQECRGVDMTLQFGKIYIITDKKVIVVNKKK